MDFRVMGNVYGFQDAGKYVYKGDFIMIRATGWINTRMGEAAGPDGKTTKGEEFDAVDDVFGQHPSTAHKKYVLLVKIGDAVMAAGKEVMIQSPEEGRLQFAINDNLVSDNSGFWNVNFESGAGLKQRFLFVNHNIPDGDGRITMAIEDCCGMLHHGSFNQLKIEKEIIDATAYVMGPDDFTKIYERQGHDLPDKEVGSAPANNQRFMAWLNQQGYDLSEYQVVFRIYQNQPGFPAVPPGLRGLMWFKLGPGVLYPYVTSIFVNNTAYMNSAERPLADLLLHEYLHVLDDMFQSSGVPEFASPHDRQTSKIPYDAVSSNPFILDREYYIATLGLLQDGFTLPPYARLSGDYGKLAG
jgi:hypothetical protein